MALSPSWVDAIHARLLVRYGAAWLRMWDGIDPEAVKADWANELHGMDGEAIKHALEHLPAEFPPTVTTFRALAMNAPKYAAKELPPPRATDAAVEAAVSKALAPKSDHDPLAWARRLRAREHACDRLTAAQRTIWRAALGEQAA